MDNVAVGNYIKKMLKERGVSQEELANHLSITPSAVSQNLSGKSSFDISNLMIISDLLGESLDNIVRAGEKQESDLEKSIKIGNTKFQEYIKNGYRIYEKDINGCYAIDYAIKHNKHDIVKYLIENNIYPNGIHENPIFIAYIIDNQEVSYFDKQYIFKKDSLANESSNSYTRIKFPSNFLDNQSFNTILENGLPISDKLSSNGLILVESLINCRNVNILSRVPYGKQYINSRDNSGTNVIVAYAIEKDNIEALRQFYNVNHSSYDDPYLLYSIRRKSILVTKELINNNKVDTYLEKLVQSNDIDFFKIFFTTSNQYYEHSVSQALLASVKIANYDIVKLIAISATDKSKNIALENVIEGDIEMVKLLLEYGAEFTYRESEGGNYIPIKSITMVIKNLLGVNKIKK